MGCGKSKATAVRETAPPPKPKAQMPDGPPISVKGTMDDTKKISQQPSVESMIESQQSSAPPDYSDSETQPESDIDDIEIIEIVDYEVCERRAAPRQPIMIEAYPAPEINYLCPFDYGYVQDLLSSPATVRRSPLGASVAKLAACCEIHPQFNPQECKFCRVMDLSDVPLIL